MSKDNRYPSLVLRDRYIPIRDIKEYYEDISEETVLSLVNERKVHYAELKDPKGFRRIPHVDMLDVLNTLGRDTTLLHLGFRGDSHE